MWALSARASRRFVWQDGVVFEHQSSALTHQLGSIFNEYDISSSKYSRLFQKRLPESIERIEVTGGDSEWTGPPTFFHCAHTLY